MIQKNLRNISLGILAAVVFCSPVNASTVSETSSVITADAPALSESVDSNEAAAPIPFSEKDAEEEALIPESNTLPESDASESAGSTKYEDSNADLNGTEGPAATEEDPPQTETPTPTPTVDPFATTHQGWYQENGHWFYGENGKLKTGWILHKKTWYYLNPDNGEMLTGWFSDGKGTYYTNSSGAMQTGWLKLDKTWYYLNSSGTLKTGWFKYKNNWYYLSKQSGAMATGWADVNGTWYYCNSSGIMQTGWLKRGNTWYYLNKSGDMKIGWLKQNGKWYYLKESGAMATGWAQIKNVWYYCNGSGVMQTGWLKSGKTWYYLTGSGAMKTGWLKISGKWYYLKDSGAMATGWYVVNEKWYYSYTNGKMAANCWVGNYFLGSSGAWIEDYEGMLWPVPGYTTITSDYGYRDAPTSGATSNHKGIDIPAPEGTSILATMDGTVTESSSSSSNGLYVEIKHADGLVTVYCHMSGRGVTVGEKVKKGDIIGYVGSTGVSTGNHLHFGVLLNGTYVSPWNYLVKPS